MPFRCLKRFGPTRWGHHVGNAEVAIAIGGKAKMFRYVLIVFRGNDKRCLLMVVLFLQKMSCFVSIPTHHQVFDFGGIRYLYGLDLGVGGVSQVLGQFCLVYRKIDVALLDQNDHIVQ